MTNTLSYPEALEQLQAAMTPVFAYCQRTHATANAGQHSDHGRLRHVLQLEQLLSATAAYAASLHSPPVPALVTSIRNSPAFRHRTALPPAQRPAAALLTSHDL